MPLIYNVDLKMLQFQIFGHFGIFSFQNPKDLPFIDANKMAKDAGYRVNSNYTLTELDSFLKTMQKRKKNVLPDFNHAMLFLE